MTQLLISNKTITLGSTIYQVRNITSIGKYKLKINYFFKPKAIVICLGIAFFAVQSPSLYGLSAVTGVLGVIGILERFLRKSKYGVSIETNAASTRFVTSEDEGFINTIIGKMHQVIQDQDTPVNYTFQVAQGDIINQTGYFENGVRL